MKRYHLHFGSQYYPCPGMGDFLSDHDDLEEAVNKCKDLVRGEDHKWAMVWDQESRLSVAFIVWEDNDFDDIS